jgi:hypothetical protein
MDFATWEWMEEFRKVCNASERFRIATKFADVKVVFMFGDKKFYWKIYKSNVIDACQFIPSFDPLGYDVVIRGPIEVWESLRSRKTKFWDRYNSFELEVGGNHMDAHRLHEAILIMCEDILPGVHVQG